MMQLSKKMFTVWH